MTSIYRRLQNLLLPVMAALAALSVTVLGAAAIAKPLLNQPVYNPITKSYFELVENRQLQLEGPTWAEAKDFAARKYFKNIQGRLAIINSAPSEMFIKTQLRPSENMWFGLSYDCRSKSLRWVTGDELKPGQYANWDPLHWNQATNGAFCPDSAPYMPAYLKIDKDSQYWALKLKEKRFYQYLIEYPTGGVEPVKAALKPAAAPTPEKSDVATDHNGQNEE